MIANWSYQWLVMFVESANYKYRISVQIFLTQCWFFISFVADVRLAVGGWGRGWQEKCKTDPKVGWQKKERKKQPAYMNKVAYKRISFFQIMLLPQKFLSSCVVLSSRPLFWQISRKWLSAGRHLPSLTPPNTTTNVSLFCCCWQRRTHSRSKGKNYVPEQSERRTNANRHTHTNTRAQQTTSHMLVMWAVTSIRAAVPTQSDSCRGSRERVQSNIWPSLVLSTLTVS